MIKKITFISLTSSFIFAHKCLVTYIIKQAKPYIPQIFYQEWIPCKSLQKARKFEFNLGCKTQHITIRHKKYLARICPFSINSIKYTK
ncbi:conserved hypothetical protein [Lebetimonas natsushimae]|uniref:Uncharacterized protein n=1 Tax=Lebetimonas natsushimae TaxID=1936991 RepID=A0A292Y911_9BACT|nr:hypothetical protein [Lebetimonas natsushimae]GAX87362.1 conserved hypothetical protein [Lebetimonas natsushimae]